jgi:putative transposase
LRRFVRTTDSDHRSPIFPNLTAGAIPDGPNQLWVADLTYVAIAVGFVYVAVITLEHAQQIAAHELPRTTKLYDLTQDQISLNEVERIRI